MIHDVNHPPMYCSVYSVTLSLKIAGAALHDTFTVVASVYASFVFGQYLYLTRADAGLHATAH